MNSMRKAVLCLSLGLLSAPAWADTTSLPLTDDAWINANNPGTNFGLDADIFVHSWGPKEGLVRFDAATISGQTVSSATLELYLSSIRDSGEISIHAITSSWNETTVTWNNQPPAESVATAIVSLTTGDAGGTVVIDVTGAVQRWADGSLADAGFLIVTSDSIKAYFDAKERAGGVPATLSVETEGGTVPPPDDGKAIVLDFSNPDDCTIDERGYYVLDRSWDFGYHGDGCPDVTSPSDPDGRRILISADHVTMDFRGFVITDADAAYGDTIRITGSYVTLLNSGGITGPDNAERQGIAIQGGTDSSNVRLYGMHEIWGVSIRAASTVLNSTIDRLTVGDNSIVENNFINWTVEAGSESTVRFNSVSGGCAIGCRGAIRIQGDQSIVQGNSILDSNEHGILVTGTGNVISNNVLQAENASSSGRGILIEGTANIIEANIILPVFNFGIAMDGSGNFYGNNRVSTPTPFLGTEGQTDWGGNVSF
jgi:hypothetical protein